MIPGWQGPASPPPPDTTLTVVTTIKPIPDWESVALAYFVLYTEIMRSGETQTFNFSK